GDDYAINKPPLPRVSDGHSLERLGSDAGFSDSAAPSPGVGYTLPTATPTLPPAATSTVIPTLAPTPTPQPQPTPPPAATATATPPQPTPSARPSPSPTLSPPPAQKQPAAQSTMAPSDTPTTSREASSTASTAGTLLRTAAVALMVLFVGVAAWRMRGTKEDRK
ncbi:MAG: hypothetical protein Q7T04_03015, partial [Dehalococcoidia bacterium]|nr:hypothetical protein [Dehalococcoidia bacterium]